jgi:anaerobic magnesium-protoporphyrin IX monomethyl ester cyclase
MTDILFTHSYFLRFDPKQWKLMQPYPPLATLYAASLMKQEGYQVKMFDAMFESDPAVIKKIIQQDKPAFLVIYDDGFNYLTKMCLTNMREAAFKMSALAKELGLTVIVSGSDAADHYHSYIDYGADFVVIGEAEQTLKELIDSISGKSQASINDIKGIAFRKDGVLTVTPKREVMSRLDELPMPDWNLLDISEYKKRWLGNNDYFSLNLVTTRGCPYKCNWCAKPIYGNRYNSHSPKRTVDEISFLISNFHPDHIWFCDDIFGLKPGWIEEFTKLVEERKLKFKFKIQSRADLLTKEETVAALARAGCETVWMGAESGSQKILDAMDKGITVEQIMKATELLKKYKIKTAFFLQFGYLGETIEDIKLTIGMVNKLLPDDIGVSVSYPLPGTKFYDKVKEELSAKSNWTDSDDLSLMFKNTYKPEFYKTLHRYVHKSYRKTQAKTYIRKFIGMHSSEEKINYRRMLIYPYYSFMSGIEKRRIKKLEPDAGAGL